jgi:hypothetical protein
VRSRLTSIIGTANPIQLAKLTGVALPYSVLSIPFRARLGPGHKVLIKIEYHSVCPLVGIGTLPPPLFGSLFEIAQKCMLYKYCIHIVKCKLFFTTVLKIKIFLFE